MCSSMRFLQLETSKLTRVAQGAYIARYIILHFFEHQRQEPNSIYV